jgi:type I restriction enzyme S subunit
MKTNWQTKKLSEVASVFVDGDWIEKKDQSREGIRLIQTGNIGNGYFKDRGEKSRYVSDKTFHRLNCTEIVPGDCLVSRLPDPVGRSCLLPKTNEKMITAVDCTIIRFNTEILPQWFVNYSLSREYQNQINKEVSGATRQRISRTNLGHIKVPLPVLSEQKRIVKKLDVVFGKLAKAKEAAEKNLQNAKELFESYLNNVFANPGKGWEERKLSELCEVVGGGTPDTSNKTYWSNDYFWVTPKDLGRLDGFEISNTERKISKEGLKNSSAKLLPIGSVILSSRAPIGHVFINTVEVATNQGCRSFVCGASLFNKFLYYFLFKNKGYLNSLGSGTTFKEISGSTLKEVKIPLPSASKQKEIVNKLDALSVETKKLEKIYEQKLADLEELKKSILSKAFRGEL